MSIIINKLKKQKQKQKQEQEQKMNMFSNKEPDFTPFPIIDTETSEDNKISFLTIITIFLIGTLSFAVALAYNNFIQSLILQYSSSGIYENFISMFLFTFISLIILYTLWKYNPEDLTKAIN